MLAQWLRLRIMEHRQYRRKNNVYIDTIALHDVPGTRLEIRNFGRDTAGGVAPMNPERWLSEYVEAVRTSHTMIFLFTEEWWKSQFCSLELSHFRRENLDRVRQGRQPLRGIGLVFPDFRGGVPGGITPVRAERKYAVASTEIRRSLGGNHREFYTVDDATLGRVMGLLGTP